MDTIKGFIQERPDMIFLESGVARTKFPIADVEEEASIEKYKKIVVWDILGEAAYEILQPRDFIYVKGYWKTRSWENKDGIKEYNVSIKEFQSREIWVQREGKLIDIKTLSNLPFENMNR